MNNLRILFLVDFYYPISSANAICVKHLQASLLSQNIKSDVICYGHKNGLLAENEFGFIYSIENKLELARDFEKNPISLLERIHNGIIWPLKSLKTISRFKNAINKLNDKYRYLGVVCVMRPIEAAMSCSKMNYVLYELDSITNNGDNLFGIKRFLKYRSSNIERNIYKHAGLIIHMRSHEQFYADKKYHKFIKKTIYSDIPGLIESKQSHIKTSNGKIIICYTGALDSKIRSPKYALDLFEKISEIIDIEINFYSRGDCDSIINAKKYNSFAFDRGYVSSEEIANIINSADFLLNIGNCFSGKVTSLPSKTIEYISTGKPIIHIDGGDNDIAKNYIQRCNNSIIISPNNNLELNVETVIDFMKKNVGRVEDRLSIEREFKENLPSYTVQLILDYLLKSKEDI